MMIKAMRVLLFIGIIMLGFGGAVSALTTMGSTGLAVATSTVVVQNKRIGVGTPTPQYTVEVRGDFVTSANIATNRGGIYGRIVTVNGTVDWSASPYQRVVVGNGGLSVKFTDPPGPCGLLLIIQRTGAGVVSFPDVLWPYASVPSLSLSETAGGTIGSPVIDILGLYFDGENYYGEINLNFR